MGVLSAAEQDEIDVVSAGIHVPRARSAARSSAAVGGRWTIAGPVRPRPGGAHSLARGEQAPGEQAPGSRIAGRRALHVREVRVSELHVREFRAAERQADGVRARSVRGRQVRSVTVRAGAVRAASVRGADVRAAGVRRGAVPGALGRAAGPVTPGSGHAGQLRVTSRGRAVLALAIVVVTAVVTAMLCWLGATGGAQAASHRAGPGTAHRGLAQVVVQPGQTLWSIARGAEPAADPRAVVQQIIEVNALGGATIQAGQLPWVPSG